jgi:uncharacterized peroxidase-related enzyme
MDDLRVEVAGMDERAREELLGALAAGWRGAPLSEVDLALCAYAEKLTLAPAEMTRLDIEALRRVGLGDEAIHDAIQVIGFFNYINRIADAVHVDLERGMAADPRGKP